MPSSDFSYPQALLNYNSTLRIDPIWEHGRLTYLQSAGLSCGGGWSPEVLDNDGEQIDVFIGLLKWQSDASRRQWYYDYSRMSYEDLGWRVEGLRKMATLGIESHCLALGMNDKALITLWEHWGFPEGGVERKQAAKVDNPTGFL